MRPRRVPQEAEVRINAAALETVGNEWWVVGGGPALEVLGAAGRGSPGGVYGLQATNWHSAAVRVQWFSG